MDNHGQLRFDGRVVVVTGAGAGLGRAYALLFASRGAKVVVNDLGGNRSGGGSSTNAADLVVNEIKAAGGTAVADYNSVVNGEEIIKTALENFGRVDVLINNAGILRDKSFARISDQDWDLVHQVHLKGAFKTSQAAWPVFRKQNYGKIIVTSSNAGLLGNFGQGNYSAAKMGLVGLCNTMAIEGRKYNIHCNTLVPTAASRLTEDILPPDLLEQLKPELIAPVVVWLCHENCDESGAVIETAGGWATKYGLVRGPGSILRQNISSGVTPEDVRSRWDKVTSMKGVEHVSDIQEAMATLVGRLEEMKSNTSDVPKKDDYLHEVSYKDCIIYALSIGASVRNPTDKKFLYENDEHFSAIPTLAIIPGQMAISMSDILNDVIPGKSFSLQQILHGEQYLEIFKPLPTSARLTNQCSVADVLDKGKHAVILVDAETFDETGTKICYAQMSVIVSGCGGFGGKSQSPKNISLATPPSRKPDKVVEQSTTHDQAALYRLNGDLNPLHIDDNFASISGFNRPILHGLCTMGFSARHVLSTYGNNDPNLFKAIKCRFSRPALPGDILKTEMWKEGNRVHFRTVNQSGTILIKDAYVDFHSTPVSDNNISDSIIPLASDNVFDVLMSKLKSSPEIINKVNCVFLYNITDNGVIVKKWTCDLVKGEIYTGEPKSGVSVDTYLTVGDKDLIEIALGKLDPQAAFLRGKLKIQGNLMYAQKLRDIIGSGSKY